MSNEELKSLIDSIQPGPRIKADPIRTILQELLHRIEKLEENK